MFLRPKHKTAELLPPPPPFSLIEFEESPVPQAAKGKKELKKQVPDFGIGNEDLLLEHAIPKPSKLKAKSKAKKEAEFDIEKELLKEIGTEDIGFKIPKAPKKTKRKRIEFPEVLEEPEIETVAPAEGKKGIELQDSLEAEEEISSAIEKAKETEKQSFFSKLFRKAATEEKKEELVAETVSGPEADSIEVIKSRIEKAREALMKFDLEAARENYAGAMDVYNRLKPEEQAKVYYDMKDLYIERKSAEQLKV